jgi:hypothetical protein
MKLWLALGGLLYESAEAAAKFGAHALRERRGPGYRTRRPGTQSPLWNICADLLRAELHVRGSKVRLARFLGIPKQRLNNFLKANDRLPDAELTLRLLNWLAHKRADRDLGV